MSVVEGGGPEEPALTAPATTPTTPPPTGLPDGTGQLIQVILSLFLLGTKPTTLLPNHQKSVEVMKLDEFPENEFNGSHIWVI